MGGKPKTIFIVNLLVAIGHPLYYLLRLLVKIFFSFFKKTKQIFSSLKSKFFQKLAQQVRRFFQKITGFFDYLGKNAALPDILKKASLIVLPLTGLIACFYFAIIKDLPHPQKLITRQVQQSTKIYDRNGQLLYKIYRQKNRTLIPLEEIPLPVQQATLAIEDEQFFQHRGLSFDGIGRALWRIISQQKIEGGSTITQQLVKNALLSPKRTLKRKTKEAILAVLVENRFSKEQILQMYFNEVAYGGAAYGIEEASQYYFAKSAQQLNLAEAALLAGLPASPTTYSPFGPHPQLAKRRQKEVLGQMVKNNFINQEQKESAASQPLKFAPLSKNIAAPHFVMYVKEKLVEKLGERFVEEGGLQVTTTLDLERQESAEKIIKNEIDQLGNYHVQNGAALITRPRTGEILAMVGSSDYFNQTNQGNFNATTALRQPGSTIKVVNYALALQNGYTLATQLWDTPVSFQKAGQPPYAPKNYDDKFHGQVSLRRALACSYNVPAVKVLASLGVDKMIALGQKMGITSWQDPDRFGLALTLGGGEVKMTDLATVYGVLANQGQQSPLQAIATIKDHQGNLIWQNPCLEQKDGQWQNSCQEQVLDPGIAFLLTDTLADNQARTPAFGYNSILHIPNHTVAVKTGTTNNLRDNWAIGYTEDFLVATWVGNNDNSPMNHIASGITGASPVWRQITEKMLKNYPHPRFAKPENIIKKSLCLKKEAEECQQQKEEYFLKSQLPAEKLAHNEEKLLPAQKDTP